MGVGGLGDTLIERLSDRAIEYTTEARVVTIIFIKGDRKSSSLNLNY